MSSLIFEYPFTITLNVSNPTISVTIPGLASLTSTTVNATVATSQVGTPNLISIGSTAVSLVQIPVPATPTSPTSIATTTFSASTTASTSASSPESSTTSSPTISSTPSSTHTPCPSKAGTIAGAAVGCLIGGALIAGLLVWLFMSSRHKKRRSRGGFAEHRPNSRNANREKSLPTAPLLGGGATGGWEQHLPQSESDSTMRTSVKALFDQIELHVENFYRNAVVSINPELQTALMKVHSSYLPDSVVSLLSQTKTQTLLIKHCLAYLIVSRITADSDAPASFLPADFVALPRAMGGARANQDKPAFAQALSRWRVLSSYLRPRAKDDRTYLSMRDTNIAAATDLFCSAFAPWATNPNDLEARRQHLINIMKSAADTGILIFSQPSRFAFRWTVPSERERRGLNRIVVLPGFVKVSDERAKDLPGQGQELVAPVVGTL